jgi:CCR4-NOT transcription complex subunit 2
VSGAFGSFGRKSRPFRSRGRDRADGRYNRGWRYHTELQVWLTSPTVLSTPHDQHGGPTWLRGPFVVFDPRTYARTKTADEFMIDASLLEATRTAASIVQEEQEKGPNGTAAPGGNGNASGNGNGAGAASGAGASTAAAGGGAVAYSR